MARINAATKSDPQFQALVGVLGSEAKAKVAFDRIRKDAEPKVDPKVQELVDAGFTEEEAAKALAEVEAPVEAKDPAEALVESQGYKHTKGRVYGGPSLAEAIVRVHKTGKPEIVPSSGKGRVAGVVVFKTEGGDVAQQNLVKAEA